MPKAEDYISEVTVSVVLKTLGSNGRWEQVAQYAVTRKAKGRSYDSASETAETLSGAAKVIDQATADAVSSGRAMVAGVQNAERRRLK